MRAASYCRKQATESTTSFEFSVIVKKATTHWCFNAQMSPRDVFVVARKCRGYFSIQEGLVVFTADRVGLDVPRMNDGFAQAKGRNFKSNNSFLWRQLTASGSSPSAFFLSPTCPQDYLILPATCSETLDCRILEKKRKVRPANRLVGRAQSMDMREFEEIIEKVNWHIEL